MTYHKLIRLRDKLAACKELKTIMKDYPDNEEAFMKYWTLMKELGNKKELTETSLEIQRICSSTQVPTNSWVEGIFKHSEMLVITGKIEEALRTLK